MIPEALHLKNFLSHWETELDLRGVHVASLVGHNGAGKSALLDAITWAVWGRSRAPYGGDENLIYHGEDFMEVEFSFRMPYQGGSERRFRILRRREQRSRRSTRSVLDLQIASENGWQSLTADSIRDTQARIIEQLGLEYDTFINSAYLRQGHADEFTIQSPTERKRVLSAILGLDRWVEYQDRTKKRLAATQGQLKEVDRRLEETERDLARRPEYEAALAQAEAQAREAEAARQVIQEQMDELTRLQEQALALRREIDDLARRQEEARRRMEDLQRQAEEHRGRQVYYQNLVDQAGTIEENYKAYQEAVVAERNWGEKLSQAARLQEQKSRQEQIVAEAREQIGGRIRAIEQEEARIERTIAEARAELDRALSDLQGQISLLEERLPGTALDEALKAARQQVAALEVLSAEQEAARQMLQAGEVEESRLKERNRQLRELMQETKARLEALEEADAACPLCRQPLTPEHHEWMLAEIQAEGTAMGDEFRANVTRREELQEQKAALQRKIQELTLELRARPQREQALARLEQQQEQGEEARERIEALRVQADEVEERIAGEDYAEAEREALARRRAEKTDVQAELDARAYAPEARAALEEILEELATLGYDAAAHEEIKAQVQRLSGAEADYRELEKARIGVEGEAEALKRIAGEIEGQTDRIEGLAQTQAERHSALEALQPRLAEAPQLAQRLNAARQQEASARQHVGAARQNLAALKTLEQRLETLRENYGRLAARSALFSDLKDAFGVNGIPAMIIEHTLPLLEREANRILEQLSGGRMHVRFETQRETKTGNLRETLDIIISDEKGTRPYENFSGGEQFRVNFAIRVALSRLLAQRSGVRLRSLFVDEGFGALDADGRRRLVEAVKAVQDDFDLILVITHIDELRDSFPLHIQVTKTDAGSQVEVV